jgi:hypothetical protein
MTVTDTDPDDRDESSPGTTDGENGQGEKETSFDSAARYARCVDRPSRFFARLSSQSIENRPVRLRRIIPSI